MGCGGVVLVVGVIFGAKEEIGREVEVGGEGEDMGFGELAFSAEDGGAELAFAEDAAEV